MASDVFRKLLEQRMAASDATERAAVDRTIRTRYERDRAVLISDMSGFSRITQEEGILHFLELIHRMHLIALPVIASHGGQLVKAEADNLYAMFDTAQVAVETAVALHDACAKAFEGKRPNDTVGLAIGIAWGRVLDLDGEDFYGDPVNLASKLGEDIADTGDVLYTRAAAERVTPPPGWTASDRAQRISNIDIDYVRLRRD